MITKEELTKLMPTPGEHFDMIVAGAGPVGRCGSTTHMGQTAGKSMGNMMDLGQAASVAAALSSRQGVTLRALDVKAIQRAQVDMDVPLFDSVRS